jgi:hypothetical protein
MNVKAGDRIRFKNRDCISQGWVLWIDPEGTIQVSENRTIPTMHFAQNWVIGPGDVVEVISSFVV